MSDSNCKNNIDPAKNSVPLKRLLFCFFIQGFFSIVIQSILFREFIVVYFGNELVVGLLMGSWLLTIALGSWLYPRIFKHGASGGGPSEGGRDKITWVRILLVILAALPFIQVFLIRIARSLLNVPLGLMAPFSSGILYAFIVIAPVGILLGMLFPLGAGILEKTGSKGAAWLYSAESFGFMAGGVIFSFVLAGRIPPFPVIAVILGLMWLSAALLRKPGLIYNAGFGLLFIAVLLFSPSLENKTELMRWKGLAGDLPLVNSLDTRYQYLALTGAEGQWSLYSNGQYDFSFPDPYRNETTTSLVMTQHPDPREILIVGDAPPDLAGEFLKWPVSGVDWVFLDNGLLKVMAPAIGREEKEILESRLLKIRHYDGRAWVSRCNNKYDLIWMNVPSPSTALLNRYYTVEFYMDAGRALKKDGVIAMFLPSPEDYMAGEMGELTRSLYNTVRKVFPYTAVSPGEGTYVFASCSKGVISENPVTLMKRYKEKRISRANFSPVMFPQLYLPERIAYFDRMAEKPSAINTDSRPVSYFLELVLWLRLTGESSAGLLSAVHKTSRFFIMAALVLFFGALFFLWSMRERRRDHSGAVSPFLLPAAASAAMAGMGLELMLIFSYQNIFGYLYQMIGLLFACFMLGMSAGSLSVSRLSAGKGKLVLRLVLIIIAVLSALMPAVLRLAAGGGSGIIFFIIVFACGLLVGTVLPLTIREGLPGGILPDRQAGRVNMADHLGGAAGAYIFGVFLVPLLGLEGSCIILAFLVLIPLAGLAAHGVGKSKMS
ncbi:MAG: hypothetical protein M1269_09545 [Chloroflexi bacterium]|nr:hypothetical protein [Chloroflexota bacterium]